jgi:hypothetical protein
MQRGVLNGPPKTVMNAALPEPPTMTKPSDKIRLDAFAMARAAGLSKAIEQFPDCVADAARAAAADLDDMPEIDGSAEPWPPMIVRRQP